MATKSFDVYADPGHAWVKVKLSDIKKLGIQDRISHYSYMRGNHAYLEEDCDASLLHDTLKEKGFEIKWREHHGNKQSKIRNYDSYSAAKVNWETCEAFIRLCR